MLPQNQLITIAALGAGAYLLLDDDGAGGPGAPPTPAVKSKGAQVVYTGDGRGTVVKGSATDRVIRKYFEKFPSTKPQGPLGDTPAGRAGNGGSSSGLPAEVEQKILNDLKKSWETATADAKVAVCRRMKDQFPNNPSVQAMDCSAAPNMAFQALVTLTGAALGGAVCGPPCSVVGSLVAAWAGPKLEEWASTAWDKAKDWGEELWPGNW